VIALRKILKDVDVWLMSASWWTDLQRKMPFRTWGTSLSYKVLQSEGDKRQAP